MRFEPIRFGAALLLFALPTSLHAAPEAPAAVTAPPAASAPADPYAKAVADPYAIVDGEAPAADNTVVPDAMQYLLKAPDIDVANIRDPFESYLSKAARRGQALIEERRAQIENRPREPLEAFDLTTLKLVAIMQKGTDNVAMVEDSTGKGYVIRRGNHIGKNNGRIEKIDRDTIYLVEQVVNPAGEVVDQQVTLTLREVND